MDYYGIRGFHKTIVIGAVNILLLSSLIMWGGIGQFDVADGPEIAGVLRWQDLLAFLSALTLFIYLIRKAKIPQWFLILSILSLSLTIYGSLMGFINGNDFLNIALEVRPFIYIFYGLIAGTALSPRLIEKYLVIYASIVALAIILQFIFALVYGDVGIFISSTHLGNASTLNLPFVRPQSFHLVAVGFILNISRLNKLKYVILATILGIALIISQSKTYWLYTICFTIAFFLFSRAITLNRKVVILTTVSLIFVVGSLLLFSIPNNSINLPVLLVQKVTDVFSKSDISYRVVGIRVEESEFLIEPMIEKPTTIVYGHGLGYLYRDLNALFYRTAQRDIQRLAMFGHNYYLWLLLKVGFIGVSLFSILVILPINFGLKGNQGQQKFVFSIFALLFSALFTGSLENPLGCFLLGLLAAGAIKSSRELPQSKQENFYKVAV